MIPFINNGTDQITIEYIEKSNKSRMNLPTKIIVDKNNHTRKVHFNPEEGQKKQPKRRENKHPEDYSDCLFERGYDENNEHHQNLNRLFLHKKTSLGTPINEISYRHLKDHEDERDNHNIEYLRAARTIISTSKLTHEGNNSEGTTEYWGDYFVDGKNQGMIVIIKDRHKSTGDYTHNSCLLSIISPISNSNRRILKQAKITGTVVKPKDITDIKEYKPSTDTITKSLRRNNNMKLEEKYETFLKENFGKSFQELLDSSESEKYKIENKLWDYLEDDTKDHESSLLANSIILKLGKYDN